MGFPFPARLTPARLLSFPPLAADSGKSVEEWSSRFQFLLWPLTLFDKTNALKKEDLAVSERAKRTRYPIRAMRYSWPLCAIEDEARRLGRAPMVVDLGCEHGTLRRLAGPRLNARWVGLDWNVDGELLARAGYEKTVACDFD